jgi:hypothetical protein
MLRTTLLAALFLTACGMEAQLPRRAEEPQPLTHEVPHQPASERLQIQQLTPSLRPQELTPVMDVVSVHSLAAADGTQVRYLVGMMGCGISVVTRGIATVQGGAFEIQYDPSLSQFGQLSLFLQLDLLGTGVCDPETSQVFEVPAQLPGSVDLSVLPAESFAGCWMFDEQN